jgi:CheY-like chemotaxis protein
MAQFCTFLEARQRLENEMMGRQRRLMDNLTGHESSLEENKILENEIENRKNALAKLEAQSSCDWCGTQVDVGETLLFMITKYIEKLPNSHLATEKICVRAECADCRQVATTEETVRAYEMLTPIELGGLKRHAQRVVQGFGQAGNRISWEDVFHQALALTFDGTKKFVKNRVDFSCHLRFAMDNICFGWMQKANKQKTLLECDEIRPNDEGDEISPLETCESSVTCECSPGAYRDLSAKEELEQTRKKYEEDKEVTALIQARSEEMTTAEIMQEYNLTGREYAKARRRLRNQKSALIIEEEEQVLGLLVRWVKAMDFAVRTASASDEGLCRFRECSRFDIVVISHSLRLNGVKLATEIRNTHPLQPIVITTTHCCEADVVRPNELSHIPILLKPFFRKDDLRRAIERCATTVREKPARCFTPKRRRLRATGLKLTDGNTLALPSAVELPHSSQKKA